MPQHNAQDIENILAMHKWYLACKANNTSFVVALAQAGMSDDDIATTLKVVKNDVLIEKIKMLGNKKVAELISDHIR